MGWIFFVSTAFPATSDWAKITNGRLHYQVWGKGNHIMDFSYAGYMGGGVALPTAAVRKTLIPLGSGQDDTRQIQAALDAVAALPPAGGLRGAVLLGPGVFTIRGTLEINASGVVLRGSGSSGKNATSLEIAGGRRCPIDLAGAGNYRTARAQSLTDTYIPSGTQSFHVDDASKFKVGDAVLITRIVTSAWVHYLGMDMLARRERSERWLAAGTAIHTDRIITAISGDEITIDAPLTDSFDSAYLGSPVGTIAVYTFPGRISNAGLEHLRIDCGGSGSAALEVEACEDCWVDDVVCRDGVNTVTVGKLAKRCTLDRIIVEHSAGFAGAPPADFRATGTQLLFNKCEALKTGDHGMWSFVTEATGTGPIVLLNFHSTERSGVAPHMRWTTGILTDSSSLPNAPEKTEGIAYSNRGIAGSGHGWTTGWSVAWNVDTPYLRVQQAPGTANWSIGCGGTAVDVQGMGTFDSTGTRVVPDSLYLEQLKERLGSQALANIGY